MKSLDMTSGNFFKKILIFAIPVMLSSILQLLFNAIDLVVIGQFGSESSLAAVGSTSALINLITNLFIGISIGANVTVAKSLGAKDYVSTEKYVHTSIAFSLIAGIFLTVFGIFTSRYWLSVMGTNSEAIDGATIYLQIYFAGSLFNMVYNFGASILRAIGDTKRPLYFLTIAGALNALLNLLFVTVFQMDVAGVALATIISQAISAILVTITLLKTNSAVKLTIKKIRICKRELGRIVLVGLPAGIQGCLISFSNVFIQASVNSFDSRAIVDGNTASANIEGFIWTSMNAFYQAAITFVGQNFGAGKIKNCKKILLICMLYAFITGLVMGYSAYFLRDYLLGLYKIQNDALGYGEIRLRIICLTYFLCGLMDIPVGAIRGLGKSIVPMIVSILGMVVFRIIWLSTVFLAVHELWIIYISYPISWIITGGVHYICFIIIYKKRLRKTNVLISNN